jgi:O-antigen/teichoic acid export membrane protein
VPRKNWQTWLGETDLVNRESPGASALATIGTQSRFLVSTGWLLLSSVSSRLAVLASTVIVSRLLEPRIFGRLAIVQTTITVLAGIASLGIGIAISQRVAEARKTSPELAGRYISAGVLLTTITGALVTVIYMIAAHPAAQALLRTSHDSDAILASAGAVLFTTLLTTLQGGLTGLERFRRLGTSRGLQSALPAIGLIIGAEASGLTGALAGMSVGNFLAASVSVALLYTAIRAEGIPLTLRFSHSAIWRRLLNLGGAAFASFLVVTAALLIGQLLLAYQPDGYTQVAVFNIGYRWHLAILLFPGALGSVLLPMMTRLRSEGRYRQSRELLRFNVWIATLASGIPALVLAAASYWILSLSGRAYSHHLVPFLVLMVAAVPSALNNVLSSASISLGAIGAWLLSDVALALAFFVTALLLIATHGATGLAFAYLAGYVATDVVLIRPIRRRLRGGGEVDTPHAVAGTPASGDQ